MFNIYAQYGLIKIQIAVLEKRISELEYIIRFITDHGLGDLVVSIIRKKYPKYNYNDKVNRSFSYNQRDAISGPKVILAQSILS